MPDEGPGVDQLLQVLARHEGDLAAGQHLDAVVGDVEEQMLQVEGVARDMQGDDLADPVARELLAVGETRSEHAAHRGQIALAGQIGRRLHRADPMR